MYVDTAVQTYLDDLASSQPTPGGGSAAALSGAMGAALAGMVARLTLGKKGYDDVQLEIEAIIEQTEQLRARFQALLQEDIAAYGRLSACFKLPRETEDQKQARTKAIQEHLEAAALVPLEVAERAAELVLRCRRIAEIGNKNVLSDVAVAAMQALSAGAGAAWMVRVNVNSMKDQELVSELDGRLEQAVQTLSTVSLQVKETVEKRG